jgi:hypothetical protein
VKREVVRKEKINSSRYAEPRTDPDFVGRMAAVHSAKCSCWMCGNPRRYSKDGLTLQEKRHALRMQDGLPSSD